MVTRGPARSAALPTASCQPSFAGPAAVMVSGARLNSGTESVYMSKAAHRFNGNIEDRTRKSCHLEPCDSRKLRLTAATTLHLSAINTGSEASNRCFSVRSFRAWLPAPSRDNRCLTEAMPQVLSFTASVNGLVARVTQDGRIRAHWIEVLIASLESFSQNPIPARAPGRDNRCHPDCQLPG